MISLAVILLALAAAGGVYAYLTADPVSVTNTFIPAEVKCEVTQTVTNDVQTAATVKNTGNIRAWIRAVPVANTLDGDGHVKGNFVLGDDVLAGTGWSKGADNYYYYADKVEPGASTGNLFKADVNLNGKLVTVLAEAIQAEGFPDTVTTAEAAFVYAKGG